MNEPGKNALRRTTSWALVVYVLFLASVMIPVTALLGLLMAWLNLGEAESWLADHHHYQIRTMLVALVGVSVGGLIFWYLSSTVGGAVLLLSILWLLARCIAGLIFLRQKRAPPNPSGWGFG